MHIFEMRSNYYKYEIGMMMVQYQYFTMKSGDQESDRKQSTRTTRQQSRDETNPVNTSPSQKCQKLQKHKHLLHYIKKQLRYEKYETKTDHSNTTHRQILSVLQEYSHEDLRSAKILRNIKFEVMNYFLTQNIRYFKREKEINQIMGVLKNVVQSGRGKNPIITCQISKLCQIVSDLAITMISKNNHNRTLQHCQPKNQKQSLSRKTSRSKKKQTKTFKLRSQAPPCPNQECLQILKDRKCRKGNHMEVYCPGCKWTAHKCPTEPIQFIDKIHIIQTGKQIEDFPKKRLRPVSRQNNIKETVERNKYQFIKEQKIIKGVPGNLRTKYPLLTGHARDIIYKNRKEEQYLPLEIRISSIPGAGLGVFATGTIKEGMLVCSYLGEIGLGSQTPNYRNNAPNNSIFTLGWIGTQILIMAPNKYSNVGRYINYSSSEECNLQSNLCLLERAQNNYQICVFLFATENISAGQELFYCYGPYY